MIYYKVDRLYSKFKISDVTINDVEINSQVSSQCYRYVVVLADILPEFEKVICAQCIHWTGDMRTLMITLDNNGSKLNVIHPSAISIARLIIRFFYI